jgi:hypothetical protein
MLVDVDDGWEKKEKKKIISLGGVCPLVGKCEILSPYFLYLTPI